MNIEQDLHAIRWSISAVIQTLRNIEHAINIIEEQQKMAKLTAAKRNKIPSSKFAEPAKRKYPIEDKAHAKNAKARATQMEEKGKISPSEASKIKSKANKVLGKVKKKPIKKKSISVSR